MISKPKITGQTKTYKIVIKRDLCIGAGPCFDVASKTFTLDAENKVYLLEGDYDDEDMVLLAAQTCPVAAIYIYNTETNEQVWPK